MVSEMGNTNSSGDQEAEKHEVETQQKGQVSVNADDVKEENNIILEGEIKEYHEKTADLPTYDTSIVKEPQSKNSEDNKTDEDKEETQLNQPFQCSEVQIDANDSPLESILEENHEVYDQTCNKKGEAEGSLSNDEVLKFDPVEESSSVATETIEEQFISSSREEQETLEKGRSGQNVVADVNDQIVTTQEDECLARELAASGDMSNEEKHEIMSGENQVENGNSVRADLDETPKVESSPQITPSNSLAPVFEPQDECMVHTSETELTSNESENAVRKCDPKETESFMQNDNATPSSESHPKEATEEKLLGNNTNTDSVMDYSMDEEDNARLDINVEQHMNFEETFEMVPEIGVVTNLEDKNSTEDDLLERMQGFESVEDQIQRDNCEFVVTEDSGVFELNISEKEIPKIEEQNVQPSLDTLDQMVPNFHYKAPETIERSSLESIPEKSSNRIELRKSPSFDFGIHRRSSESDQTPLLCPEKTPPRSLSVGSNSIMRTEYNRKLLEYEAMAVEEKTIRMERSDSDISSTPLLGLSNKGENFDMKVITSETEQNHLVVMKEENLETLQEKEISLTSSKGSGKRKPKPSFFTTCICCTTATHY